MLARPGYGIRQNGRASLVTLQVTFIYLGGGEGGESIGKDYMGVVTCNGMQMWRMLSSVSIHSPMD